jgi:hypothetical protein
MFGSWPGSGMPFAGAPSAEWPANSGIEHLFTAGLWVGAIKNGVPAVSTASFEFEFRPTEDPIDVVYYSSEGATGGNRLPHPNADDDNDVDIDEDPLDGHDNDSDGQIDEDYAAISDQMLARWYVDNTATSQQIYPDHNPLGIEVREQTYQWEDDEFDDFIGFDYTITNIGTDVLENVYVGIFMDPDIGNRNTPNYWENDIAGYTNQPAVCTQYGAVSQDWGWACDGASGSCVGVLMLDHPTDKTGQVAPGGVKWRTFATFSGNQSYEDGGDPTNDFERYELMSSETIERDQVIPRDYRFLLSVGPFQQLLPGQAIAFSTAMVCYPNQLSPNPNMAMASIAYRGQWFDVDGDPATGVEGRETPVQGPADGVIVDACRPPFDQPITIGREVVWINYDCEQEDFFKAACSFDESDAELFRTGVNGKEYQAHWTLPANPPVPVLITNFDARAQARGVELAWLIYADEAVAGFRALRAEAGGAPVPLHEGLLPREATSFLDASAEPGRSYEYLLAAVAESGTETFSQRVPVKTAAEAFALLQNHPNPFNPTTTIAFTLTERATVELSIYNADGGHVVTLMNTTAEAGRTELRWDGRDASGNAVSSGIYFYRLRAGNRMASKKMVLLK